MSSREDNLAVVSGFLAEISILREECARVGKMEYLPALDSGIRGATCIRECLLAGAEVSDNYMYDVIMKMARIQPYMDDINIELSADGEQN